MVLVKGDGGYLHTVVKDVCVCAITVKLVLYKHVGGLAKGCFVCFVNPHSCALLLMLPPPLTATIRTLKKKEMLYFEKCKKLVSRRKR